MSMKTVGAYFGVIFSLVALGCGLYALDRIKELNRDIRRLVDWMLALDPPVPHLDPDVVRKMVGAQVWPVRACKAPIWKCINPKCNWEGVYPDWSEEEPAECPKCGSPMV